MVNPVFVISVESVHIDYALRVNGDFVAAERAQICRICVAWHARECRLRRGHRRGPGDPAVLDGSGVTWIRSHRIVALNPGIRAAASQDFATGAQARARVAAWMEECNSAWRRRPAPWSSRWPESWPRAGGRMGTSRPRRADWTR